MIYDDLFSVVTEAWWVKERSTSTDFSGSSKERYPAPVQVAQELFDCRVTARVPAFRLGHTFKIMRSILIQILILHCKNEWWYTWYGKIVLSYCTPQL